MSKLEKKKNLMKNLRKGQVCKIKGVLIKYDFNFVTSALIRTRNVISSSGVILF